jgi:succinate dehydrogenase / fumarate reductase iron-sulfur subunit
MKVRLKIKRFDPEVDKKPHWAEYEVEAEPTERILDALHSVKWLLDSTLTMRRSCAHGICGSDAMRVNGRNRLACMSFVGEVLKEGNPITIEPLLGLPVIKDLVVDMEPFFEHYRSISPFLINDDPLPENGRERLQSPTQRERYDDTTKCILCACCTASCPSFWANDRYVGPQAIVQAHRFIFDSRDHGAEQRLKVLGQYDGVWRCRTVFNCTEACPRSIKVTQAIAEVKGVLATGVIDYE